MTNETGQQRVADAEARRQRILAKQKDRLARLTFSNAHGDIAPDPEPQPPAVAVQARCQPSLSPASNTLQLPVSPSCQSAPVASQPQPQQPQFPTFTGSSTEAASASTQSAELEALMAHTAQLMQHVGNQASLLQQASPPSSAFGGSAPTDFIRNLVGTLPGGINEAPAVAAAPPSCATSALSWSLPLLGSDLSLAVRETRLVRVLAAVMIALSLFTGHVDANGLWLPPAVVLILLQVLLIAGMRYFLSLSAARGFRARLAPVSAPLLPARLRAFDVSSLVPGLPGLLAAMSSARDFSTSIIEGISVFLFMYAALHWTL